MLETLDIKERLDKVLALLAQRIEVLKLSKQIGEQTQQSLSSQQREHILREQLRHIQKELGEGDEKSVEIAELRETIEKAGMPKEAEDQAKKELKRLERMPEAAAEYGMIRSYLDWLIELPWSKPTRHHRHRRGAPHPRRGSLRPAQDQAAHPRISRGAQAQPEGKSPILCFVGPPGVGKTSLGQSIARATGRKFVRLSLGGVHDEAEISGHRRTYIGALPGNIIQSIRKAGTRNPVMMLDEVDKLGAGFHGDPSSALLEVLDPEQNSTFRDNYLGVAFDLSKVMFIATANVLDTIPGPVRDRMEVIELPGYTEDEKLEIARRYLIKRQLEATGLKRRAVRDHRGRHPRDHSRLHARGRRAQSRAPDRRGLPPCRHAHRRGHRSSACASTRPTLPRSSAPRGSRTRWPCAPACPASPPVSPGRRPAATSCSSRRRACPAAAGSSSPASSAT